MELFLAVTGIIVGLMLLCGGIEGVIALKTNRKALLQPLPILCGMGWVIGESKRKKRQATPSSPKEDL